MKCLRLQLMIDAGNDAKRETALAEISNYEAVKTRAADAAKVSEEEDNLINQTDALAYAAEIAFEFLQKIQQSRFGELLAINQMMA